MADVIMLSKMLESVETALDEAFTVHKLFKAEDRDAFLDKVGPVVRGAAVGPAAPCPNAVLDKLPELEIISSFGVGYDNIDIDYCRRRGIRVTNTPDVLNDAVAETTMGLMLSLSRRFPELDAFVRSGEWTKGPFPLTQELTGKTVGILGLGRIGKEIAKRCQAFKMQVVYHGRTKQAFEPYPYYASLLDMARDVDWLVIVVPGGPETRHIVDKAVIEALGPEGALVNVGRGTAVDEEALIAALADGRLGGAALDVFQNEPNVPDALKAMKNVVLAPHVGSATTKTRWAMGDLAVRNLKAHFAGRPALTPVV